MALCSRSFRRSLSRCVLIISHEQSTVPGARDKLTVTSPHSENNSVSRTGRGGLTRSFGRLAWERRGHGLALRN